MARESTISQDQVNAIANAMRAEGNKPTARAIRDQLGTGSMATILKHFQIWQSSQVKAAETPVTLPPGLQRALVDFVAQEIAAAKADLHADLVAVQQANGDLIAESERQSVTIEQQGGDIEVLSAEKAELSGRLSQMDNDLNIARNEAAAERLAAENARTELAKAQLRLETMPRLEADIDRLRADLEKERTVRIEAEQAAAVFAAKLEAEVKARNLADVALNDAMKRSEEAAQRAVATIEALGNERVALKGAQARLDALARELEDAKKEVKESRASAKEAGETAAALRGQLEAFQAGKTS